MSTTLYFGPHTREVPTEWLSQCALLKDYSHQTQIHLTLDLTDFDIYMQAEPALSDLLIKWQVANFLGDEETYQSTLQTLARQYRRIDHQRLLDLNPDLQEALVRAIAKGPPVFLRRYQVESKVPPECWNVFAKGNLT